MRKIAFVTSRRVLAQSLADAVRARPELDLDPHPLLDPEQASLDAEVLGIQAAVIDAEDGSGDGIPAALALCARMRTAAPDCRLILLMAHAHQENRDRAIQAQRHGDIDDFVYEDASVDYLFAKIAAM